MWNNYGGGTVPQPQPQALRYVAADEDPATTPTPVINLQNANLVIDRVA